MHTAIPSFFLFRQAVLMNGTSGVAYFLGNGPAHFLSYETAQHSNHSMMRKTANKTVCRPGVPLTLPSTQVWRWHTDDIGVAFDFKKWKPISAHDGAGGARGAYVGASYDLSVVNGVVKSTQKGGSIY
jgi:hypothetical protein